MATEILNDAEFYKSYEIIGGEKFLAPAATLDHGDIVGRLYSVFVNYFMLHKNGYVHADNADVHFDDGSLYKPDLSVILKPNEKILSNRKAIFGVPDMVVEVLSRSTRKKDVGVKKDTYEAHGVREYWIIDPYMKVISVYLLRDGKYFLDEEYILFDEKDLEAFTDEEKAAIKHEVPVAILDGLKIPLEFIFSWGY